VKFYRAHVMEQLEVTSVAELVRLADQLHASIPASLIPGLPANRDTALTLIHLHQRAIRTFPKVYPTHNFPCP
jgi:hypothetical protein